MEDVIVQIFAGAVLLTIATCVYISIVIGKEERASGRNDRAATEE